MDQPLQHNGKYFARKCHRRLLGQSLPTRLQGGLGRCKPKTINHLMSLANEWADGEDSITAPKSHRRSVERDIDAKDQFHSGS
jgi:hypothetical protein